jgi:hypothetical protein
MKHQYKHQSMTVLVDAPSTLILPHSITCHAHTADGIKVLTLTYDGEVQAHPDQEGNHEAV